MSDIIPKVLRGMYVRWCIAGREVSACRRRGIERRTQPCETGSQGTPRCLSAKFLPDISGIYIYAYDQSKSNTI